MTPAALSLVALLAAIATSCVSRVNVGVLAIALAWLLAVATGGGAELVSASFPGGLFLTLAGVTLLFALAEANGTLERVAAAALRLARGDGRVMPWVLFLIASVLASAGPGAIAATALVAPMGISIGRRAGLSPFLSALVVINGANSGNLSPASAVGIIANTKLAEAGLGGHELKVWAANLLASLLVTAGAYLALGGHRARGRADAEPAPPEPQPAGFTRAQALTLAVVAAWVVSVVAWRVPLGPSAFLAALVLILLRAADEAAAFRRLPWSAVVMVTGMSALVTVVEKSGGMELFTSLVARLATPGTVNGVMALVTGLISTYSSTSGVVLPTFLPTLPGLVRELGGGDPLAIALSIDVGASLVDASPLSTLGALCVAAVSGDEASGLFRKLMLWGLSMSLVGAVLCQLFAGPFARL